ncbi:MAG: PAS domain S-box protein [Bacteroidales bacterium]|nr:PAS domain S-box protein [Bacteroidales bacterium]
MKNTNIQVIDNMSLKEISDLTQGFYYILKYNSVGKLIFSKDSGNFEILTDLKKPKFYKIPDKNIYKEDLPSYLAFKKKMIKSKKNNFFIEYRIITKNKTFLWLSEKIKISKDNKTGQRKLLGLIQDVTAIKTNEQKLKERLLQFEANTNIFKLMTEQMSDMLFYKDKEFRYIYSSKLHCEKILKCTEEESNGRTDTELAILARKKGHKQDFGEICNNSDLIVRQSEKPCVFIEKGYIDDQFFCFEVLKTPVFENGVFTGIVGVTRDITAFIQTRENFEQINLLYKKLIAQLPDILIIAIKNKIVYINNVVENMLGYKVDELINKSILNLIVKKDKELLSNILKNQKNKDTEIQLKCKNNLLKTFIVKSDHINYKSKNAVILLFTDITEHLNTEKIILNKIIESEEKERQNLSANLHDNLGPLLSTIKIYTAILQKINKTEEERIEILKNIENLTEQCIGFTRIIANSLLPVIYSDYGLIVTLINYCSKINNSGLVNIKMNKVKNVDAFIQLDKILSITIYRIIVELITNTIKHSEASNVFIDMAIKNKILTLFYMDDGKGFDYKKEIKSKPLSLGLRNIFSKLKKFNGTFQINSIYGNTTFNISVKL